MLKLGAINFNYRIRVAKQNIGRGFDYVSFAGTRRSQEKHGADGAGLIGHPSLKDLIERSHAANGSILSDDAGAKSRVKFQGPWASGAGVQDCHFSRSFVVHVTPSFGALLSVAFQNTALQITSCNQ
jgi:hypothetical protein